MICKERLRFHANGPVRFAPAALKDRLFVASDDGVLYCLAAAALWILLALIRLNLRWPWFKWAVLTAAITIDLLYSTRYLIDKF